MNFRNNLIKFNFSSFFPTIKKYHHLIKFHNIFYSSIICMIFADIGSTSKTNMYLKSTGRRCGIRTPIQAPENNVY